MGDTLYRKETPVTPLPGFKPAKSMVYAGVFPVAADEFDTLAAAMDRLTINDASVSVKRENSNALGAGFRCGFLGLLHMVRGGVGGEVVGHVVGDVVGDVVGMWWGCGGDV